MFWMPSLAACECDQFVDFWSLLYAYPQEDLYSDNIVKVKLCAGELKDLFVWKNGRTLSKAKDTSFQKKILAKLKTVNDLKQSFSLEKFDAEFGNLTTIWRIFLLHCIRPSEYPIFDQHVFRAMHYLENRSIGEISKSERKKYAQYVEWYLPFFTRTKQLSNRDYVKVDRALWSFGKALNLPLIEKVAKPA